MPAPEGYEIDDDPARVDRDAVWEWLSTQAYWHRGRSRADVERQLDGAWRVVAAYDGATGALVGFARALSDGVALAYLADVFVEDAHRGRGLGHALVTAMVDEGPGSGFRWMLHTADAHGLYAAHGFGPPDQSYLERPRVAPTGAGYRGT
ncbi:GNAT family N-acetyltransferase [Nocardioides bigeumensis]|uniref:GNAT family N-acetyltransferase n=1 Tax=Nocardioides bigeumensis TaxID=433657 RepID=A0ABP5KRX6_9ACTN